MLTAKGVKTVCRWHHEYRYTWVFGAFSPLTGKHLLMEIPCCNADAFQLFLNELSCENPKTLIIMVLDNGAFHKAKKLEIPDNIKLLFLPPYSPELNPAEKMWARLKRAFTNKCLILWKKSVISLIMPSMKLLILALSPLVLTNISFLTLFGMKYNSLCH